MKRIAFLLAVTAAVVGLADDIALTLDKSANSLMDFRRDFPGFAYADDPVDGGEQAVLKYRHCGAWTFKTSKCDDETLAFLLKNDLRILLVLDGDGARALSSVRRIVAGKFGKVIAGFQLGTKPGANAAQWKPVIAEIRRNFKTVPVAIPVEKSLPADIKSLSGVTHLAVDLTKAANPYPQLEKLRAEIRSANDPSHRKLRVWATVSDRMPGMGERDSFRSVLWKMHWLCAAYASGIVDGVIFNEPAKGGALGDVLRYLGFAFIKHAHVLSHGESLTAERKSEEDLGAEDLAIPPEPVACGNLAHGKPGDAEYLVLLNAGRNRMGFLVVNSSDKPSKLTAELKSGGFDIGTYRKVFLDENTGKVCREAMGCYSHPNRPFSRTFAPNSIEIVTAIIKGQ